MQINGNTNKYPDTRSNLRVHMKGKKYICTQDLIKESNANALLIVYSNN